MSPKIQTAVELMSLSKTNGKSTSVYTYTAAFLQTKTPQVPLQFQFKGKNSKSKISGNSKDTAGSMKGQTQSQQCAKKRDTLELTCCGCLLDKDIKSHLHYQCISVWPAENTRMKQGIERRLQIWFSNLRRRVRVVTLHSHSNMPSSPVCDRITPIELP